MSHPGHPISMLDDADQEANPHLAAARADERMRCAQIFAHGMNIGATVYAGCLAFDSEMPADDAIALLDGLHTVEHVRV
ncbi:hypothetical protein [Pararobbsia silviterrae]|uniref:Uncharacterized protein n=1 Tax=Pararobbsia silviterrae TaxID=1792498 RepID=A0A494YD36_9BURK|nr:hypothetical protein [Pararobbsia silviterrae]RKP58628.1 hypothetical protein D7S86_01405 [Pararobbsia silviterrae]